MVMIKRYIVLILAALAFASCTQYDDKLVWEEIKKHEERIAKLEALCETMNANLVSITDILSALQKNDYVTGTTKLYEDGVFVGYIIHFTNSGSVTIYNGTDGEDASIPDISIRKADDGMYYWTSDGEWMTDEDGEMIPATVNDPDAGYVVPQFRVTDGIWYVSYDDGNSWRQIGENPGWGNTSFFTDVDLTDPNYIVLTLADGQQISIPTWKAFQELEAQVNSINSSLASLQTVVEALQNNDYVTGVVPILDNGQQIGYTITFAKGGSVNIYHGKDAQDGTAPSISAAQDTDGRYYWTLDGVWMKDKSGNKIPCTGNDGEDGRDGTVPQLKIVDGYWYVSYDGGKTWESEPLGSVTEGQPETIFTAISYDSDYIYLTLADGQVMKFSRNENQISDVLKQLGQMTISGTTGILSGQLDLSACDPAFCMVSLYYSDASTFNIYNATCLTTTTFDADGRFSFSISGLKTGSAYNYCVFVKHMSKKYYSPVTEFVIAHPYSEKKDYSASSAQDLSASGSANCYIFPKSGLYKFKAVKGNSNETLKGIASAEIVWESFGTSTAPAFFELVEGVCYKDGYVIVKIADEYKEGNALVAVKDAEGNILWSWHIWMTDTPAEHTYYNDAGVLMDRNLGAISTTPGDIGAFGLLYQWGRKDPFLGSSSLSSATKAKSTITWPAVVASDSFTGTIEYASANPTTFITFNKLNDDWYYTDSAAADTTRWAVSTAPKSVYDPCPPGWRVPEAGADGIWGKALGIKSSQVYTYDSTNRGMQFGGILGDAENIWYPTPGNLDHPNGNVIRTGTVGVIWTVTVYSSMPTNAHCTYWTNAGRFYVADYGKRSRGFSVRCEKE